MISEAIIAATLLVNSAAILNFKLSKQENFNFVSAKNHGVGNSIREFLASLRYFRIFIALWNIFVMLLMILFFSA